MSRENVEVVRRIYEAGARREGATVLPLYDQGVEWDGSGSPAGLLTGSLVYRGHDGIREAFRQWYEAWGDVEHEVEEFIEAGPHVIAVGTMRGTGRASGVEIRWEGYASTWTLRDGKVVRVAWFPSREEALEAVGRYDQESPRS
jgi:ketosteroid isomerase-like protein